MEIIYFFYKYAIGYIANKFGIGESEGKIIFIVFITVVIVLGISFYSEANPVPTM